MLAGEVQKKFQNLNLHRKQKNGLNIWRCAVVHV
ncbi:TPA: DNA-binding domain-containing protein [Escherichia coli]|nr:DNA-binding domain-containing protein [Escherichia coli]